MKVLAITLILVSLLLTACGKDEAPPAFNPAAGGDGDPAAQPQPGATVPGNPAGQNTTAPGTPGAPAEPPSPLKYISLRAEPEVVDMGHPAVIIVTVNNTGDKYGTFPVELKIDNVVYSVQTIALPGGTAGNTTFNIIPSAERNLFLTAGPLMKELIIQHS